MKKLTPKDIQNPQRKSGYDHVQSMEGHPRPAKKNFQAQVGGGWSPEAKARRWFGPSRLTAEEAAQDYCDYINNGNAPRPHKLKSAGHKRPQRRPVACDPKLDKARRLRREAAKLEREVRKNRQQYVYLVIEKKRGGGLEFGKIGVSDDPRRRLTELQEGNPRPLALYAYKPGTEDDERALHQKHHKMNELHEWFKLTPEIILEWGTEHYADTMDKEVYATA